MSDLFEEGAEGPPARNSAEYTVSELSGAVKKTVEGAFSHVRVRAELGRIARPASGHLYMDLKDDRAVLAGVMWKGSASRLTTRPEEGMEVIATGRMTTFPGQSKYQLVIESLEPAGVGALMAMLEKRRAVLAAEGLFDAGRKRPLPFLPEVIGVVTSPSGAVIRDILHRLRDRFPRKVLLWPVTVQGERCAPEVANAIAGFNGLTPGGALPRPDVLIVARGGGSIEDLWGFNEEVVVRAAASSQIPLISAVGHETDTTLIDHAADRRAPTPSAAAEMAVPVRADLAAHIAGLEARRRRALARKLDVVGTRLRDLARALPRPQSLVDGPRQGLDGAGLRLETALARFTQTKRLALATGRAGRFAPALIAARPARARDQLTAAAQRLGRAGPHLPKAGVERLAYLSRRLAATAPTAALAREGTRAQSLSARLAPAMARLVAQRAERLRAVERVRQTVGYEATLARGYAVVKGADGRVRASKAASAAETRLDIQFGDGVLGVRPEGGADGPAARAVKSKPASKPAQKARSDDQGSLF